MPASSRTQLGLLDENALSLALQNYAASLAAIVKDQQRCLAQFAGYLKPQAVFAAGTQFDQVAKYTPSQSGNFLKKFVATFLFTPTVGVFNIQDADRVRITYSINNSGAEIALFGVLSTSDVFNQVPLDTGFQIVGGPVVSGTAGTTYIIDSEHACSGYRYLHLFGVVNGSTDIIANLALFTGGAFLTYQLIK